MKIGVAAPVLQPDPQRSVAFAKRAEELGFDAVCVFDHLYPLQQPDRTALAWVPVLSAIGAATSQIKILPLVARIGIRPNELMVQECKTMQGLFGDRFIAAFGIGDHLAKGEYEAYGVEYKSFDQRVDDAKHVCRGVHDLGIETWVSAKSKIVQDKLSSVVDGINHWESDRDEFRSLESRYTDKTVSWAGRWDDSTKPLIAQLPELECDWLFVMFAADPEENIERFIEWREANKL